MVESAPKAYMPATADPRQVWNGSWRAPSHCGRWWGATRSRNQRRHGADPQRGGRAALPQRVAASSPLADRSRHGEVGVVIVGVLGPLLRQQWCLDPRPRACHGFCRVCGLPPGITVKNVADSTIDRLWLSSRSPRRCRVAGEGGETCRSSRAGDVTVMRGRLSAL